MAMKVRMDRLKGIKVRVPDMKGTPFISGLLKVLKWVSYRLLLFVAIISLFLGLSEALLYLFDGSGSENYISWTGTVIVPFVVSGICWILVTLLNLDRIGASLRSSKRSPEVDENLGSLDLDN
jgi:hypothetical protein